MASRPLSIKYSSGSFAGIQEIGQEMILGDGLTEPTKVTWKGHATQHGELYARHEDTLSGTPNAGYSFHFNSTEPTTNVVIDNGGKFIGTATSADYADLAEKYLPDAEYGEGVVLAIGGDNEVTLYTKDTPLAGVVSLQPAFEMNADLEGGVYVALKGRVPCNINGSAKKGDIIIADDNGCGRAVSCITSFLEQKIGIALEDGTGTIEVKI